MAQRDYYEILGIARDATPDQIKKAYRTLARTHHPDLNPEDKKKAEAKFKTIQGAYDILSDPEKKALYDRHGHSAFEGMGGAGAGPRAGAGAAEWAARQAGPDFESFDFGQFFNNTGNPAAATQNPEAGGAGIFDDLLGRMRGGRSNRKPGRQRTGADLDARISIPFLTAVRGGETTVSLEREDGQVESLTVKVPSGVETGAKLRLRGRGEPGLEGAPAGHLTIEIAVEPHPYFRREGRDLSVEVPITAAEAVLGARVDVPTLDGARSMPIPPGTSTGQKLRLRGQGVPASAGKPQGDLFVIPKVVVPKGVDEESRRLMEAFAERNPARPRDGLW